MIVWEHDYVIKKLHDYYVAIFWKILCSTTIMQSFIARD